METSTPRLLTVMVQNLENGGEKAWESNLARIKRACPDVLAVNEASWDEARTAQFERETGLEGRLAPSRSDKPVGIFYNSKTVCNVSFDVKYSKELHHGLIVLQFEWIGAPGVVIRVAVVHLDPWGGVEGALREVGYAIGRTSIGYAPHGIMIGDFNFAAAQGPRLNVKAMQPMNHASRFYPRRWFRPWLRTDRRVGRKCLTAGRVDAAVYMSRRSLKSWLMYVAAHLNRKLQARSLVAPTTKSGRIDWVMVTKDLAKAIVKYFIVNKPDGSDHAAVVVCFDLNRLPKRQPSK